jgi:transposase
MIAPGTGVRVYLACGVTDMRKGIAGLSALTQDVLHQKPTGGAVFAFRGRRGDRIKLLYWDGPPLTHASMRCRAAGVLPLLQSSGTGSVSLAHYSGWVGATNFSATGDALGRH